MRNRNLFYVLAVLVGFSLSFNSCKKKEEGEQNPDINPENMAGKVTKSVSLDASKEYKLDGALIVESGGILNIPAGTKIIAKGGTVSYIAVAQGGKIMVEGTASKPVVMTSDKTEPGAWGGLVICGKAPVNTGKGGLSEVGNLPYGGDDANDNSGIIKYLRVEYTGYNYTAEKQFNGVSFFGVGSGTVVDYLSSYNGNDDGIEFFGGTVSGKHLVSIGSQDDGIDFADGWNGKGEFWYVLNSAKSGIEGSNNGANGEATPMTNTTLKNLTIIGMGDHPWYLKEGAGKQNIDNVVIGGFTKDDDGGKERYFYAKSKDDAAKSRISAKEIKVSNVMFTDSKIGKAVDGLTVGENADATGAGNGKNEPDWAKNWSSPK